RVRPRNEVAAWANAGRVAVRPRNEVATGVSRPGAGRGSLSPRATEERGRNRRIETRCPLRTAVDERGLDTPPLVPRGGYSTSRARYSTSGGGGYSTSRGRGGRLTRLVEFASVVAWSVASPSSTSCPWWTWAG